MAGFFHAEFIARGLVWPPHVSATGFMRAILLSLILLPVCAAAAAQTPPETQAPSPPPAAPSTASPPTLDTVLVAGE